MRVRDVMTHEIQALSRKQSLLEAAEIINGLGVEPLPVEENGQLVGMLTLQAVQAKASEAGLGAGGEPLEVALQHVISCRADDDVEDAWKTLQSHESLPGLLVVDTQGRAVGVASAQSLKAHTEEIPGEAGGAVAEEEVSFESFKRDPVDHMSEESFPASDPPPPPSSLGRKRST